MAHVGLGAVGRVAQGGLQNSGAVQQALVQQGNLLRHGLRRRQANGLLLLQGAGQLAQVGADGGVELGAGDPHGQAGLHLDRQAVLLGVHLETALQLNGAEHVVAGEEVADGGTLQHRQGIRGGAQVLQTALLDGHFMPLAGVAVAAKDHVAVLLGDLLQHGHAGLLDALALGGAGLQLIGDPGQGIGENRVQHHQGASHGLAGADGAELEAVAGEGEGGGAVAVAGVLGELRQAVDAQTHHSAGGRALELTSLDLVEDVLELATEVDRDDRRRRLVGTEAVVIAGGRNRGAHQRAVLVNAADDSPAEQQELHVLVGGAAGIQQVALGAVADRPVDVLTAAVDAGEGLLVQQAGEAVLFGRALEHGHDQLLVIGRDVGGLMHRSDLELARGHLVVAGLRGNTQAVELILDVLHEHLNPLGDGAEVVVVELLPLGRRRAKQAATGELQVRAERHQGVVHQEVLLLRAAAGVDRGDLGLTEQLQHPAGLAVHGCVRAQQRGLLVEGFPGPGDEDRGDAEGHPIGGAHQPSRAGGVPGGVAAGLEGGAQATVREGGAVGLTLHQQLAGEGGDGTAITLRGDETVVLLRGQVGERIEDVGVVEGAAAGRPVLHRVRHGVGDGRVDRTTFTDGFLERLEHLARQGLLHPSQGEDVISPDLMQG